MMFLQTYWRLKQKLTDFLLESKKTILVLILVIFGKSDKKRSLRLIKWHDKFSSIMFCQFVLTNFAI